MCKFKDFAPYVFEGIRRQFGVTSESYLRSIGVNTFTDAFVKKLTVLLGTKSSGKSGSFFFYTSDGWFMIKTIRKDEFNLLLKTLPSYYDHVIRYPETLISWYYGLHELKCYNKNNRMVKNIYIVVMNNVFDEIKNPEELKETYDLKGSTYKRECTLEELRKNKVRKDLDFLKQNNFLKFSSSDKGRFM